MSKIQVHADLEQGSDKWHELRLGKITASCFYKLLGTKVARKKYLYEKANEIVTNCKSDGNKYVNFHIQRGWEYETVARNKYITSTFTPVKEVGLVQLSNYIACSPDGLVGENGMIEIKVPDSNNYFQYVIEISKKGVKAIVKDHYIQMQFSLYVCARKWCDYVLFNPKHDNEGNGLFVFRVEYDDVMQDRISGAVNECVPIMNEYVNQYNNIFKVPSSTNNNLNKR